MRRSLLPFLALVVLMHCYIGIRLLPAMELGVLGITVGILLLLASCVLVPLGLSAPRLRRRRWSETIAWVALIAMGYFSSLLVLTFLRDIVLLGMTLFGAVTPALTRDSAV